MDDPDDAVAWVRRRFNDPTHYFDAHVLEHIARDPGFAEVIREMITRPAAGLRYRVDIGPSSDPELATAQALERLNARLCLVGAQAVPYEGYEGDQYTRRGCLWTVRVPQSHEEFVRFTVTGKYAASSGPDGEALSDEVAEMSPDQLAALRRCFRETREHLQAGLARLQAEELPETSASPADMLHFLVEREATGIGYALSHLEFMDRIVAREQQLRHRQHDEQPPPQ